MACIIGRLTFFNATSSLLDLPAVTVVMPKVVLLEPVPDAKAPVRPTKATR